MRKKRIFRKVVYIINRRTGGLLDFTTLDAARRGGTAIAMEIACFWSEGGRNEHVGGREETTPTRLAR